MAKHIHLLSAARRAQEAGQWAAAAGLYRQYLAGDARSHDAWKRLGVCLREARDLGAAYEAFARAGQIKPDDASIYAEAGLTYLAGNRPADAVELFRRAASLEPRNASHLVLLGRAHTEAFQLEPALRTLHRALSLAPHDPEAHSAIATAFLNQGFAERAVEHYRTALSIRESPLDRVNLATVLRTAGRLDEALAECDRALALRPGFPPAVGGKVEVLESWGRTQEAFDLAHEAVRAGVVSPHLAAAYARVCRKVGRAADAIDLLTRMTAEPRFLPHMRSTLLFNLGMLLEGTGEFDRAFDAYRRGNELYPRTFDPAAHEALLTRVIEAFSPERFAAYARPGFRDALPVFIIGMPRSGTSLVEQIIDSHPDAHGAGELHEITNFVMRLPELLAESRPGVARAPYPECMASWSGEVAERLAPAYVARLRELAEQAGRPGVARVTDKMPHNFAHLGLIRLLFPDAPVFHCLRDPIDTCFSCYTTPFSPLHSYATDLRHLAFEYGQYRRLMSHWTETLGIRVMPVPYERVVAEPERMTRALLEHAGLPFDPACLRFHESRRVVTTASIDQVRKPIYDSSIGRWKRFEKHLGPLVEGLKPWLA